MFHIVYKTTNKVNNKIYIGVHSSQSLDDAYLGSGVLLKKAIQKYGKRSFIRETLFIFSTPEEAYLKENEIVDLEFISRPDTYNVSLGGKNSGNQFTKGTILVEDPNGNRFRVSNKDPRYLAGELKHLGSRQGLIRMVHMSGESKSFEIEHYEDMINLGWLVWSKDYCRYKDQQGKEYWLKKDDPMIETLNLSVWTKNMKVMRRGNEIIHIEKDKVTEDMVSIVKNTVTVKDKDGNHYRVSIEDSRYISGELVGVNKGKQGLTNHLNSIKHVCPHCGKVTAIGNLKRWHLDNCKFIRSPLVSQMGCTPHDKRDSYHTEQ